MSAATQLLEQVYLVGGEFIPMGERLRIRAPEPLPADVIEELRCHKAELLRILTEPAEFDVQDSTTSRSPRYPYHFRLRGNQGGGTYLSRAPTLEKAREELLRVYGNRLLMVTRYGAN